MAVRRMLNKNIIMSDDFLDMPMSARCLYFTLSMCADDDGFVNSPKSVMRQCGATDDDAKILLAKRYIIAFETGVIVIRHWRMHNYLQKDRYTATIYQEEFKMLGIKPTGEYELTSGDASCIQPVHKLYTECIHSIGKDSIDKDIDIICAPADAVAQHPTNKKTSKTFTRPTLEEVRGYILENGYNVDAQKWYDYYTSNGWRVGRNSMKDWKAAVRTWASNEKTFPRRTGSAVPSWDKGGPGLIADME